MSLTAFFPLDVLLHCLILYLFGICQLIQKWKRINSPGLPFSVRRNKTGGGGVIGAPINLSAYDEIVINAGFG